MTKEIKEIFMFNLSKKTTILVASTLLMTSAALAGGLERESRRSSSYAPAASAPAPSYASPAPAQAQPSRAASSDAASAALLPYRNSRAVWISRSVTHPY